MKKYIIFCLPLLLSSCAELGTMVNNISKDKTLINGQRESVLVANDSMTNLTAVAGKTVSLPQPSHVTSWPQVGRNALHDVGHVTAAPDVHKIWKKSLKFKSSKKRRVLSTPVIANDTVYIYTPDSYVTAYHAKTGDTRWSIHLKPEHKQDALLGGGVVYDNNTLFVSTPFAEVFSINAISGKPNWSTKVSAPIRGSSVVANNTVFAITINNVLYALDQRTGAVKWTKSGTAENASLLRGLTPSVSGNAVIAPFSSGELMALSADNGMVLWQDSLALSHRTDASSRIAHISAQPVIRQGITYASGHAGVTKAVDNATGDTLWKIPVGGAQTPTISGDYMFMVTTDQILLCLSRTSGKTYWMTQLPKGTDNAGRTSTVAWYGPLLAGNNLYLTSTTGQMIICDAASGAEKDRIKLGGAAAASPISADGVIYVVTQNGHLIAYK